MGFEYFYGFMGGETDQWTPYLFRNTTQIFPWVGKPGYNLTTDMADEAIKYMKRSQRGGARQAVLRLLRARRHATRRISRRRSGSRSSRASSTWAGMPCASRSSPTRSGWASSRANTQLTPWPDDLPKWDTLTADEKKLFARQAEVFAAYVAYTDHEIGRVIQAVEDMGKLDNTLIIYISGDNGTSAEGTLIGTPNEYDRLQRHPDVPVAEQMKFYDAWGSATTYPAHGRGLGLGVRYAVQMDQAGGLTFRRHAAGHGDLLARPHQGRRRHPHPVPPHDRHRADDPRSHRHPRRR